jgi:hypothetical protein
LLSKAGALRVLVQLLGALPSVAVHELTPVAVARVAEVNQIPAMPHAVFTAEAALELQPLGAMLFARIHALYFLALAAEQIFLFDLLSLLSRRFALGGSPEIRLATAETLKKCIMVHSVSSRGVKLGQFPCHFGVLVQSFDLEPFQRQSLDLLAQLQVRSKQAMEPARV